MEKMQEEMDSAGAAPPRRFLRAHTRTWEHSTLLRRHADSYPAARGEFTLTDAERQGPLFSRNRFTTCCRHRAREAERIPRDKFTLDACYVYWWRHAFKRHRVHFNWHRSSLNGATSCLLGKFTQGAYDSHKDHLQQSAYPCPFELCARHAYTSPLDEQCAA
jgi:hypothetical protein